jgi:hypothetical protein
MKTFRHIVSALLITAVAAGLVFSQTAINGSRIIQGTINYCADAGGSDTYACSMSPALLVYATGGCYTFKANTANTGAATINFNSLGARTIKKAAGGVTTDLSDNDIRSGQVVNICYDGTNMQLQSGLGNAGSTTLATLLLDPDVLFYHEEFGFGLANTSGSNSTLGWGQTNVSGGTCAISSVTPAAYNNAGQYQILSGTATDGGCAFRSTADQLGALGNQGGWDSIFIFRIESATAPRHRVGYHGDQAATQSNDWFGIRADTDAAFADTAFQVCARVSAGTETCSSTGVALDTSFHIARIRSDSAATIIVNFDGGSNITIASGGTVNIVPPTTELAVQIVAGTDTNASKGVIMDRWSFVGTVAR